MKKDTVTPLWAGRYIGISYKESGRDRQGIDDWGITRLVVSEQFGIALWAFSGVTNGDDIVKEITKHFPEVVEDEMVGDIMYLHQQRVWGVVVSKGKLLTALPRHGGTFFCYDVDSDISCFRVRKR